MQKNPETGVQQNLTPDTRIQYLIFNASIMPFM